MSGLSLGFSKNRPLEEAVVIRTPSGEEIVVRFAEVTNNCVRIKIDAHKDVKIFRRSSNGKSNEKVYT